MCPPDPAIRLNARGNLAIAERRIGCSRSGNRNRGAGALRAKVNGVAVRPPRPKALIPSGAIAGLRRFPGDVSCHGA